MEQQYVPLLLALGVIISIMIGVFIHLKKRNSKHLPDHDRHIMELIIREQEKNKRLVLRLESLEEEIASLKHDVKESIQNPAACTKKDNKPFEHNLQFQAFMQNNQELVMLLKDGLSIEKAAKVSNRSVREVEMVDAVLKQRTNSYKIID